MNKKIIIILKIIFSLILLTYILIKVPFNNILHSIKSSDFLLIIFAFLLIIPFVILSSIQTKYLTSVQNASLSLSDILKINITTRFYSLFLPGTLSGGPVKWYKLSKYVSKSSAAVIVVFSRFLEILVVIVLGLLYSIPSLVFNRYEKLLIMWCILLVFFISGYFFIFSSVVLRKIETLLNKIHLLPIIDAKIMNLFNSLRLFKKLSIKNHLEIFGIMITYHLLNLISFYLLAKSLDISINIWILGWIGTVITILTLFPVSYSGLGIREGSLIYLLGLYGVRPDHAVALSLLVFLKILAIASVGGLIELKDFLLKKHVAI